MQKARRHPVVRTTGLRPLVSTRFQVLFTPLLGVLFTFPSQYWFTIGLSKVFSLTRWCWQIHTEFLRFRATQDPGWLVSLRVRDFHPLRSSFPNSFHFIHQSVRQSYNPLTVTRQGLGYSAFARHYLRNHYCFLFLRVLRCFSSPGCRPDCSGPLVFNQ